MQLKNETMLSNSEHHWLRPSLERRGEQPAQPSARSSLWVFWMTLEFQFLLRGAWGMAFCDSQAWEHGGGTRSRICVTKLKRNPREESGVCEECLEGLHLRILRLPAELRVRPSVDVTHIFLFLSFPLFSLRPRQEITKYFSQHILKSILPVSTDPKMKLSWPSHKRRHFQLLSDRWEVCIIFHTRNLSNLSGVWTFHYQQYFIIYPSPLFWVPVFNTETMDINQSIKEYSERWCLRTGVLEPENVLQLDCIRNSPQALKVSVTQVAACRTAMRSNLSYV